VRDRLGRGNRLEVEARYQIPNPPFFFKRVGGGGEGLDHLPEIQAARRGTLRG
jgi:hypothetical protein